MLPAILVASIRRNAECLVAGGRDPELCDASRLADEISARFRALCEKSGFAENFDARTGEGLRDRAYTWTASAYLILAAAHERRAASGAVTGPTAATSG